MLSPPPPVPPAPAKFLLTHEITMFSQLVNEFIVSLAGIFAALLWLNPGKSAAIRYAMILVSAGVLYTILTRESQGWQYMALTHVNYSALAILFLLGVFVLLRRGNPTLFSAGGVILLRSERKKTLHLPEKLLKYKFKL